MDIAIVTMFDAYNYGAFLQAFAMQELIKSFGHNAYILDCGSDKLRFINRTIAKTPKRLYYKVQRKKAFEHGWRRLNICKDINRKFDMAILGSDEIWNLSNRHFEHYPQFFGENIDAKVKIAYAPSIGYLDSNLIVYDRYLCEKLHGLDYIMPRDSATRDMLQRIGITNLELVCDPVCLFYDRWEDYSERYDTKKEYILVYNYNDTFVYRDQIIAYARENDLEIISACFPINWADKLIICNPFQFLSLIKNARRVITGSLHGAILSVIYGTQLFVESNGQKTMDFLKSVELNAKTSPDSSEHAQEILRSNYDNDVYRNILIEKASKSWTLLSGIIDSYDN